MRPRYRRGRVQHARHATFRARAHHGHAHVGPGAVPCFQRLFAQMRSAGTRARYGFHGERLPHQFRRVDLECRAQQHQRGQCRLAQASLQQRDVGAVQFALERKLLLREFALGALAAETAPPRTMPTAAMTVNGTALRIPLGRCADSLIVVHGNAPGWILIRQPEPTGSRADRR